VVSAFGDRSVFSLDLETSGLSPLDSRILLVQIGFNDKTYVINPARLSLEPLLPFLKSPKWLKIIQNAKFEGRFFQYLHNTPIHNVFDTFLAEKLIYPETKAAGLLALADKYAHIKLNKDVRETFGRARPMAAFSEAQLEYAAMDAKVLFPIYEEQQELLKEKGLQKIAEIEFELAGVVAHMENVGVPIDKAKWANKLVDYEKEHEESRLKMNALIFDGGLIAEQMGLFVRDGIDLNSPKQLKGAFLKLGIDVDSTNEREIALVDHPAAKELLNYRRLQKIVSSYGKTFIESIHPFTNRIHADFQQLGTETGRFSCKTPNLQQMPDEFRQCVSLSEYKLVIADYSQIELRILAELSKDSKLIEAFNSGYDLHKSTASAMFNMDISQIDADKRFIAKTINFGISYGMGVMKLRDMLNHGKPEKEHLSVYSVKQIMQKYKTTYAGATKWLRDTGERAYVQGFSETMLGRKRNFFQPMFTNNEDYDKAVASIKRQGANSPIQGTNADITKLAMVNLHNDLLTYGFRADMIIQVHDEIVVLAHKRQAEAVKEVVADSMLKSAQGVLQVVPVKVDAYVSDVWKKG